MERLQQVDVHAGEGLEGRAAEDGVDLQQHTVSAAWARPAVLLDAITLIWLGAWRTMKSQPMASQMQRSLAPREAITSASSWPTA